MYVLLHGTDDAVLYYPPCYELTLGKIRLGHVGVVTHSRQRKETLEVYFIQEQDIVP